jgi:Tetracyclin repressor-like, C-terminal domain
MRYAVRAEPIHSMDVDTLVDAVAPTLQRYLTGELS